MIQTQTLRIYLALPGKKKRPKKGILILHAPCSESKGFYHLKSSLEAPKLKFISNFLECEIILEKDSFFFEIVI